MLRSEGYGTQNWEPITATGFAGTAICGSLVPAITPVCRNVVINALQSQNQSDLCTHICELT